MTARAIDAGLTCVLAEGAVATLPSAAMGEADGPSGISAAFPELDLSAEDCALLASLARGQGESDADGQALAALLRRHRSARLNVAVARGMLLAGADEERRRAVTGPVDWAALPARFVRVASNHAPRPLFTILIATFNAAADLPETLRSIAEQHRDDVECIVIDGGSRDHTLEVARAWPHVVTQCFSQPDRGLYDALNKGLAMARGVLIGIVGAGDCYLPGALDCVAAAHSANRTDVYGGQTIEVTPEGHTRRRKDEPWGLNAFVSGGPVGHNGMFATRDAYDEIGPFGQVYPMAEDT
ncbi:MAG: glycosyltransferase, partial [Rhodobacterales bacterium]|nr:glycosyltransferase [Rhodobacterales bacterium]